MAFIWPMAPSSTVPPGRRCAVSVASAEATVSSWRATSLRSSATMAPAFSSFTSLPKVSRKASEAFTSSSNSMPFFGRNDACRNRLLFENVSRASTPVTESIVWPLLVASILPARSSDEDEQAHDLEVPAERLLGELVGEVATARGVAVVGALLDAVEHLLQRAALGAEDGLALLVAQEAEAAEDAGQPLEVLRGEERVDALLHVRRLGGGLLEAVEDLGQHLAEHLGGGLADVDGAVVGAAVVAAEVDAAREARGA